MIIFAISHNEKKKLARVKRDSIKSCDRIVLSRKAKSAIAERF